eukprot:Ihof_evm24s25 gene=Ihof_evmTU24s25
MSGENMFKDMEVATEGAVRRRLPLDKKVVCVEYPGYVKNIDKVLDTLGGIKKLRRRIHTETEGIELWYRPKEYMTHAIVGEKTNTTNLLLTIRRRKVKGNSAPSENKFQSEVTGVIRLTYRFQGMAEYEVLPPMGFKRPKMPETLSDFNLASIINPNQPMFIPPPMFSRINHPLEYKFQQNPSQAKVLRQRSQDQLFDKRPIWSKPSLMTHIPASTHKKLKYILPQLAYFFTNGPWRLLWVRLGYDPRLDPSSQIYQMIDIRLKSRAENEMPAPVRTSKRTKEEYLLQSPNRRLAKTHTLSVNNLPAQRQCFYQLCDLHDVRLQEIINRATGEICRISDGWCPMGTYAEIRTAVKELIERASKISKEDDGAEGVDESIKAGRLMASLISNDNTSLPS